MAIFYSGDQHFFHKNVLKHIPQRGKDFKDIETMNSYLRDVWNSCISNKDSVYCLGDILWRTAPAKYLDTLNGQKYLIRGDHDYSSNTKCINAGYRSVSTLSNIVVDSMPITLCHWCMRVWARSHYNAVHLYGHSHGRLLPIGKSYDVGVDNRAYPECIRDTHVDYAPYSHEEIIAIMDNSPDNPNLVRRK